MGYTNRHARYFLRLIAPHAVLYTEMITADALVCGDYQRLLEFDACVPDAEEELAKVAQVSLEKGYERFNWRKKDSKTYFSSYLLAAARRHIKAYEKGEVFNVEYKRDGSECETKTLHLACAAYNLLMICQLIEDGREDLDDRFQLFEYFNEVFRGGGKEVL